MEANLRGGRQNPHQVNWLRNASPGRSLFCSSQGRVEQITWVAKCETGSGGAISRKHGSSNFVLELEMSLPRVLEMVISGMASAKHHHVYVVELDEVVLKDRKFVTANPGYDPFMACLYVGMTGLDPREHFRNLKRGHKANRFVKKHGLTCCRTCLSCTIP